MQYGLVFREEGGGPYATAIGMQVITWLVLSF